MSETLTFAQGETTKTFTVQTTENSIFELNETFTVELTNATAGAIIDQAQSVVKGTINNNDPAPVFSIAAADALEGGDIVFTVTRTGDAQTHQSVTVSTSIAGGDTASANDFTAISETLTFAQGETSKTFTVETTQDADVESNETFTVTLSNATDGAEISSTNGTAQGTIVDDDTPAEFSIASASAEEGNEITFTVTRSRDNLTEQTVDVSTSIGSGDTAEAEDFTATPETLTFAQGETTKTFTVQTTDDSVFESDETFTVTLTNATGGAEIDDTQNTATGTIINDDPEVQAEFSILSASVIEAGNLVFTVTRTGDNLTEQTVDVSTSIEDGDTASENDFTANNATLTFAQGETTQTFTVQTTDDSVFESNETFTVELTNATGGAEIDDTQNIATGTIINDDSAPAFSISSVSATEASDLVFTVTRTGDAESEQAVDVSTFIADGDTASENDFTANNATLTFAQGETEKTFTVQTTANSLFESDETFTVELTNATGGAEIDDTQNTATGTINNDDPVPVFSIASATATEGSDLVFTVTRTGDAESEQAVDVSTSIDSGETAEAEDFTATPETLTFAQGETEKTFTVQTTQDFLVEEDEKFTVSLNSATNGATISSTNGTAEGTINDNDVPFNFNNNNIFTIKGSSEFVALRATLLSNSSTVVNELGVFLVDDAEGTIDGVQRGDASYNEVALERARLQGKDIFSALENLPTNFATEIEAESVTRLLGFDSGQHLQFFLVNGGTIDEYRAGTISSSSIIFGESFTQIVEEDSTFQISWRETTTVEEFSSLVVRIESVAELTTQEQFITTITQFQETNQGELIDLRDVNNSVRAEFSVFREAFFSNEVYFYSVDNEFGLLGSLEATAENQADYIQAAINRLITDVDTGEVIRFAVDNQGEFRSSATIEGGSIIAPMIIIDGTLSELTDGSSNNDPTVYFPFLGVNSDGADHIRMLGDNVFGFEDLPDAGDKDYNDVITKFSFTEIV
ncbi:MAG: DUF4114 domain-containing protein [Sphaerospermopsis sp. SIO1G1]|nr:DUF4114 domain-containing protein [Sphaerospermopsis sp. SIO1G1]